MGLQIVEEKELQSALLELAEMETALQEIAFTCSKVSESFDSIAQNTSKCSDLMLHYMEENKRAIFKNSREADSAMFKAAVVTEICGMGVKAVGNIVEQIKRNKELNKLLDLKKDIANQKRDFVIELQRKTLANAKRFEFFLIKYAESEYLVSELSTVYESQRKQMLMILEQYRLSYLLHLIAIYTVCQYDAWLSGRHDSMMEIPNRLTVNKLIINETLYPITQEERNNNLFESEVLSEDIQLIYTDPKILLGRVMFVLFDKELFAYQLRSQNKPYDIVKNNPVNKFISMALDENEAYKEVQNSYHLFAEKALKGDGTIKIYVIESILFAIIVSGIIYLDMNKWLSLTIIVISLYFIVKNIIKKVKRAKRRFYSCLSGIKQNLFNNLNVMAGYKPQELKDDVEKKGNAILGAIIGGVVGLFFGPIGVIVGIIIGANVASGSND